MTLSRILDIRVAGYDGLGRGAADGGNNSTFAAVCAAMERMLSGVDSIRLFKKIHKLKIIHDNLWKNCF